VRFFGFDFLFSKTAISCKKKFNIIFKQYKKDKMKNEVQAIIIMNANFTTPWTFGGAK
jgi:hypothetical protein